MIRKLVLFIGVSFSTACFFETSATVPYIDAFDMDSTAPDATKNDSDDGPNNSNSLFSRDTLPRGTTCDAVPTEAPDYECNPVLQDCGGEMICALEIVPSVRTECRAPRRSETFDLMDGEPCDTAATLERCRLGARCLGSVCRALCEFDGAVGCEAEAACETVSDTPLPGGDELLGYGACVDSCRG